MDSPDFTPLPPEVIESYLALKGELGVNGSGCLFWAGPKLLPAKPGGPRRPVMPVYQGDVYEAAKVAWALAQAQAETVGISDVPRPIMYPLSYVKFKCGNPWCVNGEHIALHRTGTRKRHRLELEETYRYQERFSEILTVLTQNPLTTVDEIHHTLRAKGIGGNLSTVQAIIHRVRRQLGLPARVSRPRAKVTSPSNQ